MSDTFGAAYAQQYDLLYQDKNYDAEVALLERLFRAHGLAQHGYDVTGVDRSPEMLRIARVKAEQSLDELSPQPSFVEGDVTSVRLGGTPFDAALMMFAVLGYQVTNEAVRAALHTVRAHLRPGALFVCDVWYGPAVLSLRPSERTKVVDAPGGQVIRSFSLAMMWGIFVATYSSVFICSPMLIYLGLRSDSIAPAPMPEEKPEAKPRARVA